MPRRTEEITFSWPAYVIWHVWIIKQNAQRQIPILCSQKFGMMNVFRLALGFRLIRGIPVRDDFYVPC